MPLFQQAVYNAVFISDLHIGSRAFDSQAFLSFIKSVNARKLYLVGDILDGWKLARRWHWPDACTDILEELFHKQLTGTEIIYVAGNHDEILRLMMHPVCRPYLPHIGLKLRNRLVHETAKGLRYLVMHGDQFDHRLIGGPLSRFGDFILDRFHAMWPGIQAEAPKPRSLAKILSRQGQRTLRLIGNFEHAVREAVKTRGLDGLICGHTHIPVIKNIRDIHYANCGCWLRKGHTALVEKPGGDLALIDWPDSRITAPDIQPRLFDEKDLPEIRTEKTEPLCALRLQARARAEHIVRHLEALRESLSPARLSPDDIPPVFTLSGADRPAVRQTPDTGASQHNSG